MKFYDVESEFYDLFYFSFDKDIEVYRRYICSNVLDLMCGTGRILHHLNPDYGVGIDINENMLIHARKNLEGRNVKLIRGDVLNFSLDERFCLVIIGFNSLLMFSKDERVKILKNAEKHLSEDGKVIVDILNPFMMVEGIVHHGDTIEKDGIYYSRFFVPRWKGDKWELLYFYDIVENEVVRRKYAKLYLYSVFLEDLREEAEQAGLEIKEIFGDYDFSEFDEEESERIIAVMERRI